MTSSKCQPSAAGSIAVRKYQTAPTPMAMPRLSARTMAPSLPTSLRCAPSVQLGLLPVDLVEALPGLSQLSPEIDGSSGQSDVDRHGHRDRDTDVDASLPTREDTYRRIEGKRQDCGAGEASEHDQRGLDGLLPGVVAKCLFPGRETRRGPFSALLRRRHLSAPRRDQQVGNCDPHATAIEILGHDGCVLRLGLLFRCPWSLAGGSGVCCGWDGCESMVGSIPGNGPRPRGQLQYVTRTRQSWGSQ